MIETINKQIGYEASLADIDFDIKSFEDRGLLIKLNGYQDTLINFANQLLTITNEHANGKAFESS